MWLKTSLPFTAGGDPVVGNGLIAAEQVLAIDPVAPTTTGTGQITDDWLLQATLAGGTTRYLAATFSDLADASAAAGVLGSVLGSVVNYPT